MVVVDLGRLRDAVKQLGVGGDGRQVQVLAHHLRFPKQKVVIGRDPAAGQTTENLHF